MLDKPEKDGHADDVDEYIDLIRVVSSIEGELRRSRWSVQVILQIQGSACLIFNVE